MDRLGIRLTTLLSIILCIAGFLGGLYFGYIAYWSFAIGAGVVGVGGALWLVTKNVLLPIAIGETGYSDTVISGLANVVFTVFTIVGTIAGSFFAERYGVSGSTGLSAAVLFAVPFALFFRESGNFERIHTSGYISSVFKIVRAYFPYIFSISLLWAVITALAQIFVEA